MALSTENLSQQIREFKAALKQQSPDYKARFESVTHAMEAEIARIKQEESEGSAIPQFEYAEIAKSGFTDEQKERVHLAGCCIVRNTLPSDEVSAHNENLSKYIIDNGYYDHKPAVEDNYFSQLKSDKPQIFGIYWSQAQVWARQHQNMATLRRHLNHLWQWQDPNSGSAYFNPDLESSYADRVRRREPGDATLGLSPHVDSGSIERWIEPHYRDVYHEVFHGDWTKYQAFDGQNRVDVEEFPSPAVCSVFRTFQGWVALTPQGKGDGTLQTVPSMLAMPFMLLRAIQDDVEEEDLCGAAPGRALTVYKEWHPLLLEGLVSIPKMQPGDTVWWHPDTIHAVEDKHNGDGYSNVLFIGAAPDCEKNRAFLAKQRPAFLNGDSCPDFAAENHERNYEGRATEADLSPLGRQQMGFE
ncbi:YbiU family protein [Enterovibrio baiacu]|uniref:YbiU family protein n=1 Tax=Enterovibrio baiacu TaxID=2491023 RepID=UPI003D12B7E8